MKIGFVSTTISIVCLASSTEARLASRNLVGVNTVEGTHVDPTDDEALFALNHSEDEEDTPEKIHDEQPKALPSFDQVMHEDAPKHGMYVEGGSDRIRSFCARHNHFGPNSGCEQHQASLRGSRVRKEKVAIDTNGHKDQ